MLVLLQTNLLFVWLGNPSAPTNLKVKDIGKDFVSVEWSPPKSDGGSKLIGYRLLIREDGSDEWKEIGKVGGFDSTYTFKNLSDKKKYFFAVVAENKLGQSGRLETENSVKPKRPSSKLVYMSAFSIYKNQCYKPSSI